MAAGNRINTALAASLDDRLLQDDDIPSPEDVASVLKQGFALFEDSATHTITFSSLKALLETLGQAPTELELKDLVAGVGATPTDALSYEKVEALVLFKLEDSTRNTKLRTIFDGFDADGDGFINASDLHSILTSIGNVDTSDATIRAMLHAAGPEAVASGKVSFSQFKALLTH